jgi:hypothetical protein
MTEESTWCFAVTSAASVVKPLLTPRFIFPGAEIIPQPYTGTTNSAGMAVGGIAIWANKIASCRAPALS